MRPGRPGRGRSAANDEKETHALDLDQGPSTRNLQHDRPFIHGLGITDDSLGGELGDDADRHDDCRIEGGARTREDVPDRVTRSQGAVTSGDNTPAWEMKERRQSATKTSITERWETDLTRYFFDDGVGVKRYSTSGPVMGEKIE